VLMEGMTEFAEEILGMPVRLGVPIGVKGITQLVAGPQYATGVGLVLYGANALTQARERISAPERTEIRRVAREPKRDVTEETPLPRRSGGFWNWLRAAF
jgi:cell division protein FtsA